MPAVGAIMDSIISQLERAALVVVDLTGLNPNVMFEMGIRDAWACPLIPIAPKGIKLPLDVAGINTVFYPSLDGRKVLTRKEKLKVIKEIRAQAHRFLSDSRVNSSFDAVMKRFGEKCSLNAVYRAKRRTLEHLELSLRDLLKEFKKDHEFKTGKKTRAFKNFGKLFPRPFATLRDRTEVLHFAAEGEDGSPELNKQCVEICRQMMELQKKGERLLKKFVFKKTLDTHEFGQRYHRVIADTEGMIRASERVRRLIRLNFS